MSILELRNVEKIYGEKDNQVKALRNINLKVEEDLNTWSFRFRRTLHRGSDRSGRTGRCKYPG